MEIGVNVTRENKEEPLPFEKLQDYIKTYDESTSLQRETINKELEDRFFRGKGRVLDVKKSGENIEVTVTSGSYILVLLIEDANEKGKAIKLNRRDEILVISRFLYFYTPSKRAINHYAYLGNTKIIEIYPEKTI